MRQNIPFAAVGVLLAISVLVGVFILWPNYRVFSTLQAQLHERQLELKSQESYFAQLQSVKEDIAKQLPEKIAVVDQSLPDDAALPSLYDALSQQTSQSGLSLRSLNTSVGGAPSQSSGQSEKVHTVDIRMDLAGTYESLKAFFTAARRQPRLLNIKQFNFASPATGKIFNFSIALEAYSY